jgi:hypothetical protein
MNRYRGSHSSSPAVTLASPTSRPSILQRSTDLARDVRRLFQIPLSVDLRSISLAMAQKNLRCLEPEL